MTEKNQLDDLLRGSLEDYKAVPNPDQRARFLDDADNFTISSGSSNNKWIYIGFAALLLFGITAGWMFYGEESVNGVPTFNENTKQPTTTIENGKSAKKNEQFEPAKAQKSETKIIQTSALLSNTSKSEQYYLEVEKTESSEIEQQNSIAFPLIKADNEGVKEIINSKSNEVSGEKVNKTIITSDTNTSLPADETAEGANPEETKKDIPAHKEIFLQNHTTIYSLYYRPEMIYNIIEDSKLMHAFGAEFQFKLFDNKYVIGTGVGLSVSEGYYEYAIDYNEFLGTFKKLDSISYSFNEANFQMTQTVHTSESQVFDTATQTDYARVYRQFVYLQIPLTLGYDFVQKENYSIGVRFSSILSILLTNEPIDFQYDAGQNQIIQINQITPERVKTNWQLAAGFNYTHSIGNRFVIELEPRFTYYFNSVYQKSDHTKTPYGFGIRLAVGIR